MQNLIKCFSNSQPDMSNPIRERVIRYLTENDWNVQHGDNSLNLRVRCSNAIYPVIIYISEEDRRIQVYSHIDVNIPENKRSAVAEYCTRANFRMDIGNFEFDMDNGNVQYKTYLCLGDNIEFLTDDILENMIGFSYSNIDNYYPGIMRILYSNESDIKKIIDEIENPVKT